MKKLLLVILLGGVVFIAVKSFSFPSILPSPQNQNSEKVNVRFDESFSMSFFAKGVDNARDLTLSPEGTLLLSLTSSGKVVALPDKNSDGRADGVKEVLSGLQRPHGLAFYNNRLFIAEETRVVRYNWDEKKLMPGMDRVLFDLPQGGRHFTRSIVFDNAGKMFVSIGSTCDVCFEKHSWIGTVIVSDENGKNPRVFAKGLRNSVFIAVHPATNQLWGTEMGRDFLGDNVPPDEINIITENKDYGWPICYGNRIHDTNFDKNRYKKNPCVDTEPPVYEIAAHSASLGLVFINSPQFPKEWQGDLLVAYHGSWNRSVPIGYKVVRLNVEGNRITAEEDFITEFLDGIAAKGRPVDLTFDNKGNLYISDDKAGVVYRVSRK